MTSKKSVSNRKSVRAYTHKSSIQSQLDRLAKLGKFRIKPKCTKCRSRK